MVLPAIFYSIYCILIGNLDTSTWYILYDMKIPIDTTTIIGWYVKLFIFQAPFSVTYGFVFVGIVSHFLSCCYYILAGCEHIYLLIDNLNYKIKTITNIELKSIFIDVIKMHNNIFE